MSCVSLCNKTQTLESQLIITDTKELIAFFAEVLKLFFMPDTIYLSNIISLIMSLTSRRQYNEEVKRFLTALGDENT